MPEHTTESSSSPWLSAQPPPLDYWRKPRGVAVPDDELRFLLVPDAVVAAICLELAHQVHAYQQHAHTAQTAPITKSLLVTMGGLLPGVLLYDHLVEGRAAGVATIEFGTIGVSLYKGPGERHTKPRVQQAISVPVIDETVLVIDDLGDEGGTMHFLTEYVLARGARKVLNLVMYMKPRALARRPADFYFGETPQHTWIIMPRERVETLMKRVPVWRQRGASLAECRRRLIDLIGYTTAEIDYYLPKAFAREALAAVDLSPPPPAA